MLELTFKKAIKELEKISFAGNLSRAGKSKFLSLSLLAAFILLPSAFAKEFIVSKDGNHDYTSIKAALNDSATSGETIIVKPDTYYESNLSVTFDRTLQAENINSPESTIIDATGSGKPVISGAAWATIIGFTIRGGTAEAGVPGGGIHTVGGHVVLKNLIIENNYTSSVGGGVGTNHGGTVEIINCIIRNNRAMHGGGIRLGSIVIVDSRIEGNEAFGDINGFAAGGGIAATGSMKIENSTITGNRLTGYNQNKGAGITTGVHTTLNNVTISNNIAMKASALGYGGGIRAAGDLYINGGSISGNVNDKGGGIALSHKRLFSSAVISGNIARENSAGSGGGIYCEYLYLLEISSGTVSGNTPDDITCLPSGQPPSGPAPERDAADDARGSSEDPVNTYTGELFNQYSPDIYLGGPMPLFFARYYASGLLNANISGSLGDNWRHNFEWTLTYIGTNIYIFNNRGRLIQFTQNGSAWDLAGKTDIVYQLVENTGAFTLLEPRNKRLYKFNSTGRLTSVEDGKGNVHTLSYDVSGLLTQVADGQGRTLSFAYDSSDLLIGVGDSARTIIFSYTGNDLTGVTDALGNLTNYTYATGGLMTATTSPAGNKPYTQTFKGSGKVATQTDAGGNTFSFDYSGLDTTLTDPLGNTRVHTHTATGEFSNRQDQAGESFTMGSDATGRRNSITDRLGDTTTIDYHTPSGRQASKTNADGTSSSFSYTARSSGGVTQYDLTGITNADGSTESYVYDANGNLTSHTDRAGNTSSATYNGSGQPLTATNVAGGVATNTYNADGTLATTTDPAGNKTTFGYDSLKRPNLITFADGNTQSFTYNDHDQLLTSTDGNGNTAALTYDGNGNLATATDPLGHTTTYNYDGNDRLLSVTDPLGNTTGMTYNQLGKIKTITDKNGNVTTMEYNTLGRLTSITDPLGNVNTITYDAEFIIASSTEPLGNTTTFASDAMGRINSTTSPLGNTSNVTYDTMGRVKAAENPLGQTTTLSHDARGLLSSITLPGSITASYTRNKLGLITGISDPAGSNWQRVYDSQGRQTSAADPLGNTISYQYDKRNRVSQVNLPAGTLDLSYDAVGNITRRLYSDGTDLNYTFDAMDRLTGAEGISLGYDANGRITGSNGLTITRDAGGRIATITLAPGKTITYTYDSRNQLTRVADWLGGTTTFTYDAAGRLSGIARPNGVATNYSYDSEDRLTGITEGSISGIVLTRDSIGKITTATRNVPLEPTLTASTKDLSFDAASQVSTYTYDGMGHLTNDGTRTYTWDLASRMTGYTEDANTVTFTYDALGSSLSRTKGGATRSYVWNYALGLPSVSVAREGGNDLRYYIYTPGGSLLYSIEAADNSRRDYHFDEMGNTMFLTDPAGAVIASYAYSPYGEILSSTGSLDNPFTWQGKYGVMGEGNGLYYMRARYYDSVTERFISRDPVKSISPKEINPYQYALGNPLRFVDVTGRDGSSVEELVKALVKAEADEDFQLPGKSKWRRTSFTRMLAISANMKALEAYSNAHRAAYEALRGGSSPQDLSPLAAGHFNANQAYIRALFNEWGNEVLAIEEFFREGERISAAQKTMVDMFVPTESKREANKLHLVPPPNPELEPLPSLDEPDEPDDNEIQSVIPELAPLPPPAWVHSRQRVN